METVKITFELSKDYIKGILAILGIEKETPVILEAIGDNCEMDIDKIAMLDKDLAQMKIALVAGKSTQICPLCSNPN